MELTRPRSPTISRAIEAYVVSDVTTLTGAAGAGLCPPPGSVSRIGIRIASMSVRLVFVWTNGPNRLERDLVIVRIAGDSLPLVLGAKKNPLALPHGERGDQLSCDDAEVG